MPAWVFTLGGFLKNLIPSPFRFLLNPWVLVSAALVLSHGYVFLRGKAHERRSQANAIFELNTELSKLREEEATEEAEFQKRLNTAVSEAKAAIPISEPGKPSACALDEGSIRRIRAIVKSAQVTP
jgi:hypothetical protein